jgi:nucleotide-binding universal stress UspA family protein
MSATVVGIDLAGTGKLAVQALAALRLPNRRTVLISAVEPLLPDGDIPSLSAGHPLNDLMAQQASFSLKALEEARSLASDMGEVATRQEPGAPLTVILQAQVAEGADLIAVGSSKKGWLEGLFLGSVTRGLAVEAPCSFLVAKDHVEPGKGLTLVAAFDGSEYSQRCLLKLAEMKPAGVARIVVAGAIEPAPITGVLPGIEGMESVPIELLQDSWDASAALVVAALRQITPDVEAQSHVGHPHDVLNSLMGDEDGDILVMGSHGAGFFERLILGSTTMHMVVREEHNVLVLKA